MAAYTGGAGIPVAPDFGATTRAMIQAAEMQNLQRAEAIRWQGAQEYDTLIKSGVSPQDAFARTAPKLFYNDPRALAASIGQVTQGQGQFITDENTGAQFIIQPNGRIQPWKPPWQGSMRVTGPNNQVYTLPLTPGQRQAAPTTSVPPTPPQVVPMPGGPGQMIVQPGGVGRPYMDPTEIVTIYDKETGTTVRMRTGEYKLKQALEAAKPLLDEYRENKGKIQTEKVGWNWNPWNPTYAERQKAIKDSLAAQGLDTEGNPLPGSDLSRALGLETGTAPAPAQAPATPPPAAPAPQPPAAATTPPPPTLTPRQIMRGLAAQRRENIMGTPAITFAQPNAVPIAPPVQPTPQPAPQPAPQPVARTPRPNVPLAPNEVLVETVYGWAIYDKTAKKFVAYADERATR